MPIKDNQKRKEYARQYREVNKDKRKEYAIQYREVNKDKIKEKRDANRKRIKEYNKEYREANKDKIREYNKEYREANKKEKKEEREVNKDKIKEKRDANKDWKKEYNKIKVREYRSNYTDEQKQKIKEQKKLYREANKDKLTAIQKEWYRNEIKNNTFFKLKANIRTLVGNSFRRNGYKKSSKTEQILGCSFEEFKRYLESKFENWMNWDNRGLYNGTENYGWDIDHIMPLDSAECEEDIIKLNHHTNLQPLCSHYNRDIKKHKH